MPLAEHLADIRAAQAIPAYDDGGDILPDAVCVYAVDLQALIDVVEAAQTLATAADALLDVVIWSPDVSMKSRKVTALIGTLNKASEAWQKLTDPTWPQPAAMGTPAEARDA